MFWAKSSKREILCCFFLSALDSSRSSIRVSPSHIQVLGFHYLSGQIAFGLQIVNGGKSCKIGGNLMVESVVIRLKKKQAG